MSEIRPSAPILWRLFVIGGMGTLAAVSIDDDAWETFDDMTGGATTRTACRVTLVGALSLHLAESISAWRAARRAGVGNPLRWAFGTFLWGFPVLLRLRGARKELEAAA
jgi:hypothetical protein